MKKDHNKNIHHLEKQAKELNQRIKREKQKVRIEIARLRKSGYEVLGKAIMIAIEHGQLDPSIISDAIKKYVTSKKDLLILNTAGIYQINTTENSNEYPVSCNSEKNSTSPPETFTKKFRDKE